MRLVRSAILVFAAISMLNACGSAREVAQSSTAEGCAHCHGLPPAQGAHEAHLVAGTYSAPLACESCHIVPEALDHMDGRIVVEFSALARQGVANPGYAGSGGTCSVYCHGSTPALGNNASPAWTSTGGLACGGCHDTQQNTSQASGYHRFHVEGQLVPCASCHPGYAVGASPHVNLSTHLNGAFDASPINTTATFTSWPTDCSACH